MDNSFTLSDHAIIRIVDLLQLAMLTGTDIIDNLRTLRLSQEGSKLVISASDNDDFVAAVARLEARINELAEEGAGLSGVNVD
jgi:hypothetical protein